MVKKEPGLGYNSSASSDVAGERLLSIVQRIENVREEKEAFAADEREIFSEAKGAGFDVKILREVLKRRKLDKDDRDNQDYLRDTYELALESILG